MKKAVISFVSVICAVMLCLAFAGCGEKAESVAGNTYVYESCTVSDPAYKDQLVAVWSDLSYSFNEDGTYDQMKSGEKISYGVWKQNGDEVTLTEAEFMGVQHKTYGKVKGDKLELSANSSEGGLSATLIFKKQPQAE